MHVLEEFSLPACGDRLGENRKPTVFLEALKQVVGRGGENRVDQINDSVGTWNDLSGKASLSNRSFFVVHGNKLTGGHPEDGVFLDKDGGLRNLLHMKPKDFFQTVVITWIKQGFDSPLGQLFESSVSGSEYGVTCARALGKSRSNAGLFEQLEKV